MQYVYIILVEQVELLHSSSFFSSVERARHGGVDVSVISWLYLQLSRTEDWQPGWKSLADQEQDVLGDEISCSEGKGLF